MSHFLKACNCWLVQYRLLALVISSVFYAPLPIYIFLSFDLFPLPNPVDLLFAPPIMHMLYLYNMFALPELCLLVMGNFQSFPICFLLSLPSSTISFSTYDKMRGRHIVGVVPDSMSRFLPPSTARIFFS